MKTRISISDFRFVKLSYGIYKVSYTSPVTGRAWVRNITDMELIDSTKNAYEPKIKDLNALKRVCKANF